MSEIHAWSSRGGSGKRKQSTMSTKRNRTVEVRQRDTEGAKSVHKAREVPKGRRLISGAHYCISRIASAL